MNLRSSDLLASSKTLDTVWRVFAGTCSRLNNSFATHTIGDESRPPLNSAQTGPSLLRRHLTASVNNSRNCISYSLSDLYLMLRPGSGFQNRSIRYKSDSEYEIQ